MSHENTITVESDGKYYVIPTVIEGKKLSKRDATQLFMSGQIKPFGVFSSQQEADNAAKKRSEGRGSILRQLLE